MAFHRLMKLGSFDGILWLELLINVLTGKVPTYLTILT